MVVKLVLKRKNENIHIWSRYSLFKNTGCRLPASSSAALSILKRQAWWRPIECLWLIESVTHVTNLRWFSHGSEVNSWPWEIHRPHIKTRFIWLDTFTDKCRLPHPKLSSTTSCVPLALSSSTSQRNFVIDDTDWMGIIFHKYNTPSYSYALYKSVRMQTITISLRERSQSNHKVPKRRRLSPSWDVVDDRPPHQLVHGAVEVWEWISNFIVQFTRHVITYPCRDYKPHPYSRSCIYSKPS